MKLTRFVASLCFALVTFAAHTTLASACPLIHGLVDYNCDQDLKIVVTGDSIVSGVGDKVNDNEGGYVLRLKEQLPLASVVNLGIRGITSDDLVKYFSSALSQRFPRRKISPVWKMIQDADYFIIDVGRNDYYEYEPVTFPVESIAQLIRLLKRKYQSEDRTEPFLIVSTLIPSARRGQDSFVKSINKLLLKADRKKIPAYLRFDRFEKTFLSKDLLHPTSRGYDVLEFVLESQLRGSIEQEVLVRRQDLDNDGIYDRFETKQFGTSPLLFDTDGDGKGDGQEIFTDHTNPLVVD